MPHRVAPRDRRGDAIEFVCLACFRIVEISYAVPPVCPSCQSPGHWKAIPDFDTPTRPYDLNADDCAMLRTNKIDPEA